MGQNSSNSDGLMSTRHTLDVSTGEEWVQVTIEGAGGTVRIELPGRVHLVDWVDLEAGGYSLLVNGWSYDVTVREVDGSYHVSVNGKLFQVALRNPKEFRGRTLHTDEAAGPRSVAAPMPGKVVRLLVQKGDTVEEGQGVAVVEAMKMQNELRAPRAGTVKSVEVAENQAVNAGESLLVIE